MTDDDRTRRRPDSRRTAGPAGAEPPARTSTDCPPCRRTAPPPPPPAGATGPPSAPCPRLLATSRPQRSHPAAQPPMPPPTPPPSTDIAASKARRGFLGGRLLRIVVTIVVVIVLGWHSATAPPRTASAPDKGSCIWAEDTDSNQPEDPQGGLFGRQGPVHRAGQDHRRQRLGLRHRDRHRRDVHRDQQRASRSTCSACSRRSSNRHRGTGSTRDESTLSLSDSDPEASWSGEPAGPARATTPSEHSGGWTPRVPGGPPPESWRAPSARQPASAGRPAGRRPTAGADLRRPAPDQRRDRQGAGRPQAAGALPPADGRQLGVRRGARGRLPGGRPRAAACRPLDQYKRLETEAELTDPRRPVVSRRSCPGRCRRLADP